MFLTPALYLMIMPMSLSAFSCLEEKRAHKAGQKDTSVWKTGRMWIKERGGGGGGGAGLERGESGAERARE